DTPAAPPDLVPPIYRGSGAAQLRAETAVPPSDGRATLAAPRTTRDQEPVRKRAPRVRTRVAQVTPSGGAPTMGAVVAGSSARGAAAPSPMATEPEITPVSARGQPLETLGSPPA